MYVSADDGVDKTDVLEKFLETNLIGLPSHDLNSSAL
jgi:hypothetical protein